ncbi:tRNA (adenosine(37)-N6)-threonylcarbamoyltransferase complex dimerization subunit type 1 TsaB [Cobetia marina]|jgi:tRNA threonylcarbamoyladenosine biosynthesis protein TsaB|uniref:tRNA threonylcarbamoyladenosine biosynthesis protein TsaB n=1 Tax=Cobetia marina TaxID=28258 RepID=A0ABU9GGZ1_COBMA|nr:MULTISPECIES: tRNA (adenosine(37)-N6)-threonylcarbamoyltransferase complex dimerization subunit type 1 TsaB [Cobetia]AOM00385.1 tRNA (adenosine(37)-N6)-threonylcarbamoyltransferase complex dimerization subunit type 1 TsaB [Cobetia marina]AZV30483.1 tRNA (adenosine(37)-N6)-threonylcarbamoyltransferase complex dimerization subunit type 1 TsaB [Cobetia sp. ICG0124]MDA5565126.1 tRNA (adenosine(37)-N6)-threonylcarbamoyltransferase complex dimerization subunit type 1 TsaB [Cobetia sp. MMG027]MDH22
MTTLLAIDASSSACSVALWQDGVVTAERCEAPRQHTQLMMPMIETLLADAQLTLKDLDALAYGHGPGSFTGLRIAAGTIQGLAFGLEVPVIGVSTLAALALQAHRHHHARFVLPMLDARMGELYTGAYRVATSAEGEVEVSQLLPEQVVAPGLVELPQELREHDWLAIGSGLVMHDALPEALRASIVQRLEAPQPDAEDMVILAAQAFARGEAVAAVEAQPVYLRNEVAWR